MRELERVEKEAPWEGISAAAASAGLYEEHEIKADLVIGPEVLQPPDFAYALQARKLHTPVEVSDAGTSSECFEENLNESASSNSCSDQLVKKHLSTKASQTINNDEKINPKKKTCNKEIVHPDDNPLQSKVSSEEFLPKQYLTRHKRTHSVKKLYSCTTCKKQFKEKIELTNHMKNHTRQESFPRDICNKQFVSSQNLINHKQMHAGDTPYSCDTCKIRFSHKSYLNTHKRIHKTDKPCSCNVCGKQFSTMYQLSNHKQSHISEKPYFCKNCKKRFANNKYFLKHIWNCKM